MNVFIERVARDDLGPIYTVAIDYQSGVLLFVRSARSNRNPPFDDPGLMYLRIAESWNGAVGLPIAHVENVLGLPALIIDRTECGFPSVDLTFPDRTRVTLMARYAPTMDANTVREIAASIA